MPGARRTAFVSMALACVLFPPGLAAAQRTGGSFGSSSGSWGGSHGSSGSSSGSSSHGSSSWGGSSSRSDSWSSHERSSSRDYGTSQRSSDYGSSSGGFADPDARPSGPSPEERWKSARVDRGAPAVTEAERAAVRPVPIWFDYAGVVFVLFGLSWVPTGIGAAWKRRPRRQARALIRRLSVGFDWTVREELQRRLSELASSLSIETGRQRAKAARELLALLRANVSGACYAYGSATDLSVADAPGELARVATDLRARFTYETRGRAGAPAPEIAARPEEGAGMLVITLVTGSTSKHRPLGEAGDRRSLDALLAGFVPESALEGLEVIWSPAEDADRMSSYELERFYPELVRLSDADAVGTVRCAHCAAVRPRELDRCPRCGATDLA